MLKHVKKTWFHGISWDLNELYPLVSYVDNDSYGSWTRLKSFDRTSAMASRHGWYAAPPMGSTHSTPKILTIRRVAKKHLQVIQANNASIDVKWCTLVILLTGYDRIRCLHKRSRLETPELRELSESWSADPCRRSEIHESETNFGEWHGLPFGNLW